MLLLLVALAQGPSPEGASDTIPAPRSQSRAESEQADSLFARGAFYEAATEYERCLFRRPLEPPTLPIRHRLVRAYARNGELARAEQLLSLLPASGDSLDWPTRLVLAQAYLQHDQPAEARAELNDMLSLTQDSVRLSEVHERLGWLSVEHEDFSLASDHFRLARDTELASECNRLARLPARDPDLASLFSSVFPGAGEIYAGKPGQGLIATAVSLGLAAGVVACLQQKCILDAAILFAVFWGRLYSGSRANAYSYADQFNRRVREQAARTLRRNHAGKNGTTDARGQ
jgi:hypothetical protein